MVQTSSKVGASWFERSTSLRWVIFDFNFLWRLSKSVFFFFNSVAEFLSSASRHLEACEQRVRAAELSPSDYSLVVSAATALRLLEKKQEAEKWYRLVSGQLRHFQYFRANWTLCKIWILNEQGVKLRPDDARSHTNLGAILHLLGRTAQAAVSYRNALKIQPGDPTTLANLAKLGVVEVAWNSDSSKR